MLNQKPRALGGVPLQSMKRRVIAVVIARTRIFSRASSNSLCAVAAHKIKGVAPPIPALLIRRW